jgi:GntR family transcriptional regulator
MNPTNRPAPSAIDTRLPRYQRLRDELNSRIAAQEWKVDEPIPTEAELAGTFGVSIGTVRKAIDALVADGRVERIQGTGTFVRRPKFGSSLFRFFRFEGREGEKLVPESRILKREVIGAPEAVAAALGLSAGAPAIHLNRLRLVDHQPLLLESIWLPKSRFAALLEIDPREFGDLLYPLYEQYCGQVVASARETLTAEAVGARNARLLEIPPGSPVIVIERIALSFDGRPLEWRRSHGAADQFRYHVEIR